MAAFGRRIDTLAWMSPATKAKAKEKLGTLRVGVGYPDQWRDDSALVVSRQDALGNLEQGPSSSLTGRASPSSGIRSTAASGPCSPTSSTAVNLPIRNALKFPAGILVPPYFDPSRTPPPPTTPAWAPPSVTR